MDDVIRIREASMEDAAAISSLIAGLCSFFLADPDDIEAAAPFFETISPKAIEGYLSGSRFRYHVAELGKQLAGVVAVRDQTHLYHLFVAEPFHRRGLAAALWQRARDTAGAAGNPAGSPRRFTVNSSRFAVSVYQRFGFVATGPEIHKDGLIFVPMELVELSAPAST